MSWFLWALFASFCAAALAESNRIFRLDAQYLNAWRSTIATLFLMLALPYMEWPNLKSFYVVAAIDGVTTAIGMILFFRLAAKRTGRVSSMVLPLAAFGAYVTWWMMYPAERPDLMEEPFRVLLAAVSFTMVCMAFQKVRDNDASWESFLIVLPVGITFGIVDALTKDVLGATNNFYQPALSYTLVSLVICSLASWIAAIPRPVGGRTSGLFDKNLLWGGFWCGFWTVGMMLAGVLALSAAPNPSLPSLLMALTPVWLFGYNYLRKVNDEVSIPASALIIVGAVGLLLSTL